MIACRGLFFTHRTAAHEAIKDLSFSMRDGSLLCLAGKNGSGKSTLLGLLAGVYAPDAGSTNVPARVGLVPQDPDVYILGSLVEEDLLLALDPADKVAKERALHLAERFGLADLLKETVYTLSYGQKKKLSLASALAAAPELLLLDEPFAGLDYPAALAMREALAENRRMGLSQIVCEHDLDLVADLADDFLLLNGGELVGSGGGADIYPLLEENGVRPPCWWLAGESAPLWNKAK